MHLEITDIMCDYSGGAFMGEKNICISDDVRKLKEIQKKQELHRQQLKEQRDKTAARKHRTHRLIVRGAIAEHALGLDEEHASAISSEHFETLLYCALNQQNLAGTSSTEASQNPSGDARGSDPR